MMRLVFFIFFLREVSGTQHFSENGAQILSWYLSKELQFAVLRRELSVSLTPSSWQICEGK